MFASKAVLRMTREESRHTPNSKVLSCHKACGGILHTPLHTLGWGPAIALVRAGRVCSTAAAALHTLDSGHLYSPLNINLDQC